MKFRMDFFSNFKYTLQSKPSEKYASFPGGRDYQRPIGDGVSTIISNKHRLHQNNIYICDWKILSAISNEIQKTSGVKSKRRFSLMKWLCQKLISVFSKCCPNQIWNIICKQSLVISKFKTTVTKKRQQKAWHLGWHFRRN